MECFSEKCFSVCSQKEKQFHYHKSGQSSWCVFCYLGSQIKAGGNVVSGAWLSRDRLPQGGASCTTLSQSNRATHPVVHIQGEYRGEGQCSVNTWDFWLKKSGWTRRCSCWYLCWSFMTSTLKDRLLEGNQILFMQQNSSYSYLVGSGSALGEGAINTQTKVIIFKTRKLWQRKTGQARKSWCRYDIREETRMTKGQKGTHWTDLTRRRIAWHIKG